VIASIRVEKGERRPWLIQGRFENDGDKDEYEKKKFGISRQASPVQGNKKKGKKKVGGGG